jgi:uncharacterized integral membrane protein
MSEIRQDAEGENSSTNVSSRSEEVVPETEDEVTPQRGSRRTRRHDEEFRHTRISAVWAAVFVAVLFGVALVDFIAQNTRDVRINFFSVSGRMPGAVALLAAALAGAIVVLAVGVCRVAQLRLNMRRQRRHIESESGVSRGDHDRSSTREDDDSPGRP